METTPPHPIVVLPSLLNCVLFGCRETITTAASTDTITMTEDHQKSFLKCAQKRELWLWTKMRLKDQEDSINMLFAATKVNSKENMVFQFIEAVAI